jgi:protein required for attachment to host cells
MVDPSEFLLPNEPTCVVACAPDYARFWLAESRFGQWETLETLENSAGSQQERTFASDRPGRAFDSFGSGRHALSSSETGREHESRAFARVIARQLEKGLQEQAFMHIVLIATPRFLGHLRKSLSEPARKALAAEFAKDATEWDTTHVKDFLR